MTLRSAVGPCLDSFPSERCGLCAQSVYRDIRLSSACGTRLDMFCRYRSPAFTCADVYSASYRTSLRALSKRILLILVRLLVRQLLTTLRKRAPLKDRFLCVFSEAAKRFGDVAREAQSPCGPPLEKNTRVKRTIGLGPSCRRSR